MLIGIIGPMDEEIMPFINKLENLEQEKHAMLDFYKGRFEGKALVAVRSGIGKVNASVASQILIDKYRVDKIILTGVAGALDSKLEIGDIVLGDEIIHHDLESGILMRNHPFLEDIFFESDKDMVDLAMQILDKKKVGQTYYKGRIITGETFVTDKERDTLIEDFNPLCVDMESASLAHTAYVNDIPFMIIRSMSDSADESGLETFEENLVPSALKSLSLLEEILRLI